MKIPLVSPNVDQLIRDAMSGPDEFYAGAVLFGGKNGPAPGGKYRHWDDFLCVRGLPSAVDRAHVGRSKVGTRASLISTPLTDLYENPFAATSATYA